MTPHYWRPLNVGMSLQFPEGDAMQKLKATIRIDFNTKQPTLFYYDDRGLLQCFTFEEGHSAADVRYMYQNTTPLMTRGYTSQHEAEIIWRFRRHYLADGDGVQLHLKNKISYLDNRG